VSLARRTNPNKSRRTVNEVIHDSAQFRPSIFVDTGKNSHLPKIERKKNMNYTRAGRKLLLGPTRYNTRDEANRSILWRFVYTIGSETRIGRGGGGVVRPRNRDKKGLTNNIYTSPGPTLFIYNIHAYYTLLSNNEMIIRSELAHVSYICHDDSFCFRKTTEC